MAPDLNFHHGAAPVFIYLFYHALVIRKRPVYDLDMVSLHNSLRQADHPMITQNPFRKLQVVPAQLKTIVVFQTAGQLAALWAQSSQNVVSFDPINPAALANEGIRGLCVSMGDNDSRRLLIQNFSARQILNRGALAFRYDGNTFDRLTEPSFSIANNLAAILHYDYLKFKSFTSVKMIFDLANVYQEASDAQIGAFGAHASLHIADIPEFKGFSDQGIRKLVTAIGKKKVLDNFTPAQIVAAAATTTLTIDLDQGKIVMPRSRAEAKKLLHFLDEGFYKGPLSGVAFITNSKRRA